jgi:hypothetical protein
VHPLEHRLRRHLGHDRRVLSRHMGYNTNLTGAVLEACTTARKAYGDE